MIFGSDGFSKENKAMRWVGMLFKVGQSGKSGLSEEVTFEEKPNDAMEGAI